MCFASSQLQIIFIFLCDWATPAKFHFCFSLYAFQMDDDGGGGIEREADYDALNDETFGSAINGDWEGIHENLVLLDTNGNTNGKNKDETDDGDLGDLGME